MHVNETVEIRGHLMDSGVLGRILDDIREYGGDYLIDQFDLGKEHDDESYARIVVGAEDSDRLARLVMRLQGHGVNLVDPGEAVLRPAVRDGVFPDDFYSTTNLETVVRLGGAWVPVENPEMDCGLVVTDDRDLGDPASPHCFRVRTVPVCDVRAGDRIVCGAGGVRVVPVLEHTVAPDPHAVGVACSGVSPGRAQALLVRQISEQIREVKAAGRRVLWVCGPAVVHTGAAPAMAALVRAGFVDVLFAGNALATHDIEAALYGTALVADPSRGRGVEHGHEHHLRAINQVRKAGSITAAVRTGLLITGVMHALVAADARFVLVGSVRDDGPLPDVYTDVVAGQRAMRQALEGVGLAVMVATMLHSVATGSLLPASVPLVCVDINPATVAKLADRGSSRARGIVTDVGLFLEQLAFELVPEFRGQRGAAN